MIKKINLYLPSTLLNQSVYEKLTDEAQGNADLDAINLTNAMREIKGLCDAGFKDTYQVQNLVHQLRATKERLEEAGGDLFVI